MQRLLPAMLLLAACQGGDGDGTDTTDDTEANGETGTPTVPCTYPEGAADVMALGEVMPAFSWPDARHLDGRTATLELETTACNTDDDIDWSPFDVLLFVSIPAW